MRSEGGLSLEALAAYYRAADVHLSASSGEGFGLPTLQAAAAGAVPLAGAYSASLELVEGHGEPIPIADWSETEFGIRRALIDVDEAATRLARLYEDRTLLRERSAQSHQFARTYDWSNVVRMWDELLASVARGGFRARPREPDVVRIETLPAFGGAAITVKRVERPFGRLEAAIVADARRQTSDVRLPVMPKGCEVAGVRVPRRFGRVCVGPGSARAFVALRQIFPRLEGWSPFPDDAELMVAYISDPEEARYELAQSILLLDLDDELEGTMLAEAALYAVPRAESIAHARALLTDPALAARAVAEVPELDLDELAASLAGSKEVFLEAVR
jgi:hypothetical protein